MQSNKRFERSLEINNISPINQKVSTVSPIDMKNPQALMFSSQKDPEEMQLE